MATEGVHIQTRKEANLFNVARLKARTKTNLIVIRGLFFADDSALISHSATDRQVLVDKFAKAASQFSLKINIKKTACLYQRPKYLTVAAPTPINEENQPLRQCAQISPIWAVQSHNPQVSTKKSR